MVMVNEYCDKYGGKYYNNKGCLKSCRTTECHLYTVASFGKLLMCIMTSPYAAKDLH